MHRCNWILYWMGDPHGLKRSITYLKHIYQNNTVVSFPYLTEQHELKNKHFFLISATQIHYMFWNNNILDVPALASELLNISQPKHLINSLILNIQTISCMPNGIAHQLSTSGMKSLRKYIFLNHNIPLSTSQWLLGDTSGIITKESIIFLLIALTFANKTLKMQE